MSRVQCSQSEHKELDGVNVKNPVELLKKTPSANLFLDAQFGEAEQEEGVVGNTPELASESFDFDVERLRGGICGAVDEVVQYCIIVIAECFRYGPEPSSVHFIDFIRVFLFRIANLYAYPH